MKSKKLLIILLLFAFPTLSFVCDKDSDSNPTSPDTDTTTIGADTTEVIIVDTTIIPAEEYGFEVSLNILDITGWVRSSFYQGENIQFELKVKNTRNSVRSLVTGTPQKYDFFVRKKSTLEIIWRWGDRVFVCIGGSINFNPYEEKTFIHIWDQKDGNRVLVGSGTYGVQGMMVRTSSTPQLRTDFIQFKIF